MIVVSEPGVYRLVFRSRKPAAERFKRWLAHEVLPALRKTGQFAQPDTDKPDAPGDAAGEAVRHRLDLEREARILFGATRARSLWRQLGLPAVTPPPLSPRDEAYQCLRHLLDSPTGNGARVRDLLANALEDDEEARLLLLAVGIRVTPPCAVLPTGGEAGVEGSGVLMPISPCRMLEPRSLVHAPRPSTAVKPAAVHSGQKSPPAAPTLCSQQGERSRGGFV